MTNTIVTKTGIALRRPRLGFLGVGWIGRNRMEALIASGLIDAAAIAEPSSEMIAAASTNAPSAKMVTTLDELLQENLDGIVIATPSAQHAAQCVQALEAGLAVFCQKPLGRTAEEVRTVIGAAKGADRLLGVDLSYRYTAAMQLIRQLILERELGDVRAIDLTFHNAYGPGKPWFYEREQSGGGCVIDLGVHLIDIALWALDFPKVLDVSSNLLSGGRVGPAGPEDVEDYAIATLSLANGTIVRLACSWGLHAGCDCVIDATFHGTQGGATMRNVDGSFYNFVAEGFVGTSRERLVDPPDDWSGRAAIAWASKLSESFTFDTRAEHLVAVSETIDRIYRAHSRACELHPFPD